MIPPSRNTFPLFPKTFLPSNLPLSCTGKSSRNFLFSPMKLHLLFFQVKWVDVSLAENDIARDFSEILPDASVQIMPLRFAWGCRTFQTASHVHVIHIWGVWQPSQVVDGHMASHAHLYHHRHFPGLVRVGWNATESKCANHATTLWLRL